MFNLARYEDCIDLCVNCMENYHELVQEWPILFFKLTIRLGRANIERGNFADAQGAYDALTHLIANLERSANRNIAVEKEMRRLLDPFERHLNAARSRLESHPVGTAVPNKPPVVEETSPVAVLQLADLCPHLFHTGKGPCTPDCLENNTPNQAGSGQAPGASPVHTTFLEEGDTDNESDKSQDIDFVVSSSGNDSNRQADGHDHAEQRISQGSQSENRDETCCCFFGNQNCHPSNAAESDADHSSDEQEEGKPDVYRPYYDPLALEALAKCTSGSFPVISSASGPCSIVCLSDIIGSSSSGSNPNLLDGATPSTELSNSLDDPNPATLPPSQSPGSKSSLKTERDTTESSTFSRGRESAECPTAPTSKAKPAHRKGKDDSNFGFKRGFLDSGCSILPISERASPQSAAVTPKYLLEEKRYPEVCYDSDRGSGPSRVGCVTNSTDEEMLHLAGDMRSSGRKKSDADILTSVIGDVLGKSFLFSRTIDFNRIFGHHVTTPGSGKRRRKSCVSDCGTCFARKMWKLRFVSSDHDEAEDYVTRFENHSRLGQGNFPSNDDWHRSGYYASGYEMAFDEPALIHGVAYICHLQSELHWRGDKVPFLKDIQHSFISSLERHTAQAKDFDLLLELFLLLRETIDFISQCSSPSGYRAEPPVQFGTTAANAANSLFQPSHSDLRVGSQFFEQILATRSKNLFRNLHTWAIMGQVAREESWIYHLLLRDLHHLIAKRANFVKEVPVYLEPGKEFSEVFEKACGERSKDERHWKCRIVSIIERIRCRNIERVARAARDSGHLDHSINLYTCAIGCRPLQARLFHGRAQTLAVKKSWRECLSDVRGARSIVESHPWNTTTESCCPTPQNCILVDILTLEADVVCECVGEAGHDNAENLKMAIEIYKKAYSLVSGKSALKTELFKKINMASQSYTVLALQSRKDLSRGQSTRKPNTSEKSSDRVHEISRVTSVGSNINMPSRAEDCSERMQIISSHRPKGKRRKSRKRADKATGNAPKSLPATDLQNEASSEDDDQHRRSLAGNPYAALLEGVAPVSLPNVERRGTSPSATKNTQPTLSEDQSGRKSRTRGTMRNAKRDIAMDSSASTHTTSPGAAQKRCDLCNVSFSGIIDRDNHMRGKRHQMALKRRAASGSRSRQAKGVTEGGPRGAPSDRSGRPGPSSTSQGHARVASVRTEEAKSRGPREQEALAEAERAIAILGGEARPCDVVARMNFSKWNIQNVNDYLERHFGGLLALCLPKTDTFRLSPGSESRPVLLLVNRVRRTAPRRNNLHRPNIRSAIWQRTPVHLVPRAVESTVRFVDDIEFPTLDSNQRGDTSERLQRIMQEMSSVSDWSEKQSGSSAPSSSTRDIASSEAPGSQAQDMEVCGICLDEPTDVRCIPCKHEWCETCILDNMKRGRFECPFCMREILRLERLVGELD